MTDDAAYLAKCLAIIEEKLGWGKAINWQQRDFDLLSEKIFDQTKVLLSASTLKRILGKTRYESKPSMPTLNALSQFAGFESWRAFVHNNNIEESAQVSNSPRDEATVATQHPLQGRRKKNYWPVIAGLLAVIIATSFIMYDKPEKPFAHLKTDHVYFSAKKSATGIPNTVLFSYNASQSDADSIFIQQSWDIRRRYRVDKNLQQYNLTYYYPGYYRAKLVLNDLIIKDQDLFIESVGWMGIIEREPVPVYLPHESFNRGFPVAVTEKDLTNQHIDLQKDLPVVDIVKVDSSINIPGDQVSLTVSLRNTSAAPPGVCRKTGIVLMGTEGVIDIPLCEKGCVGEIGLVVGMQVTGGRTTDLSAFGVDFSRDAVVNCSTTGGILIIRVNDNIAWQAPFKNIIGRVVGAKIRFRGSGVVNQFQLQKAE